MNLTPQDIAVTNKQEQKSTLWILCSGFVVLHLLIAFFSDDLMQLPTPFLYPILLIILAVILIIMLLAAIVFIPVRFKKISWKAFLPLFINGITLQATIFLFLPLSKFRYEAEFLIKKKNYQEVIGWIDTSIANGQLVLEEHKPKLVILPTKFQNATPGGIVIFEETDEKVSVLFPAIFQGTFEYSPSFLYRPSDKYPKGIITPDLKCKERKELDWYYCF